MPGKTHRLIGYGRRFYERSGSRLPALTEEGTGRRSDWGQVELALESGDAVVIRPATAEEKWRMQERLDEILDGERRRR